MTPDSVRVTLDTNICLRGLFRPSSASGRILQFVAAGVLTLVTSEPLIAELEGVLARPEIRRKYPVSDQACADLVALLREQGEFVAITGTVRLCRDPKDDMLIETALAGRADALVTEDKDVLVLDLPGCRTLTAIEFLRWLESAG